LKQSRCENCEVKVLIEGERDSKELKNSHCIHPNFTHTHAHTHEERKSFKTQREREFKVTLR